MKQKYVALELELLLSLPQDVITTSGGDMTNGDFNYSEGILDQWRGEQ